MTRLFAIAIVVVMAAGGALLGCATERCENVCGCGADILEDYDGTNVDEDECVSNCEDDYMDDGDCRDAVKDLSECIDDEGCDDDSCASEWQDAAEVCSF